MKLLNSIFLIFFITGELITKKSRKLYVKTALSDFGTGMEIGAGFSLPNFLTGQLNFLEFRKKKLIAADSWDTYQTEIDMKEAKESMPLQFATLARYFKTYRGKVNGKLAELNSTVRRFMDRFNRNIRSKLQNPKLITRKKRLAKKRKLVQKKAQKILASKIKLGKILGNKKVKLQVSKYRFV